MNYDQWKLSNPIDDGYGYGMVSRCCGAEIIEGETSNCSECKEHADVIEMVCAECGEECDEIEDYEYEAIQRENWAEMMRDDR